jgi:N-acetyltransferase
MASAELVRHAFRLLENNFDRSNEKQKAMVGIHQIWVHSKYRRQKIASRLVDIIREKMFYGCVVPRDQVAFSSPTLAGAAFARRYNAAGPPRTALVYDCK